MMGSEQMETNKKRIIWITRTGILVALLIAVQWLTAGTQAFAGQYITGSLVNCILAISVLFGGLWSGVAVAALSPVCAFLLGIGPKVIQVVPAIALGNLVLVMALHILLPVWPMPVWRKVIAIAVSAAAKFVMLYLAVVQVLIPAMGPSLPEKQAAAFSVMFSYPQLITAIIGSTLAMLLLPVLRKAIK